MGVKVGVISTGFDIVEVGVGCAGFEAGMHETRKITNALVMSILILILHLDQQKPPYGLNNSIQAITALAPKLIRALGGKKIILEIQVE